MSGKNSKNIKQEKLKAGGEKKLDASIPTMKKLMIMAAQMQHRSEIQDKMIAANMMGVNMLVAALKNKGLITDEEMAQAAKDARDAIKQKAAEIEAQRGVTPGGIYVPKPGEVKL